MKSSDVAEYALADREIRSPDKVARDIAYALATQRLTFDHPRPARFLRLSFDAPALPTGSIALAGIGAFTVKR